MPTPPVVLVHEFEVTYGFIDLVGVSPTGAVTVVECKLQGNPDMKRTIVGQLFAYAAGLWGMSYADFDEAWQAKTQPFNMSAETWERRKRGPLVDEMAAAVAEHGLTWDRDTFPAAVEANLAAGRYTLVFAVDDITPELRRIVEYLSEHTAPEVSVIALEIRYLRDGDTEVLVPQPYGQEMAQRKATVTSTRPHVAWDMDLFDAALRETKGETTLQLATNLREWALAPEIALEVSFGRGTMFGTEGLGLVDPAGRLRALFSLWTNGGAEFELGNLKYFPAYAGHEARLDVLRALSRIEGRTRKDEQADGWPQFSTDVLLDPARLAALKALLADIVSRIRQG